MDSLICYVTGQPLGISNKSQLDKALSEGRVKHTKNQYAGSLYLTGNLLGRTPTNGEKLVQKGHRQQNVAALEAMGINPRPVLVFLSLDTKTKTETGPKNPGSKPSQGLDRGEAIIALALPFTVKGTQGGFGKFRSAVRNAGLAMTKEEASLFWSQAKARKGVHNGAFQDTGKTTVEGTPAEAPEETPEASVDLNEVVAQLGQLGAGLAQLGQIVQSMQK